MTSFSKLINFRARWFLWTFAPLLLFCVPAVAQKAALSAPMTADEVMKRVAAMSEVRAKALDSYSSLRRYHLECRCLVPKQADMVVRADYHSPNHKEFNVVSESGSGTVRHKVFLALLDAELESTQPENQQRSAVSPENYTFHLVDYQKTDKDEFYVLEATPRTKNKFLFRGRIWVDAKDFAITQVMGEPAVNPSWWTRKTDFIRTYQKVGDVWLPQSNESVSKVSMLGTAVLTIHYQDYQVRQTPAASDLARNMASNEQ
jgi:outer membrane lipoprotein-sorting protein